MVWLVDSWLIDWLIGCYCSVWYGLIGWPMTDWLTLLFCQVWSDWLTHDWLIDFVVVLSGMAWLADSRLIDWLCCCSVRYGLKDTEGLSTEELKEIPFVNIEWVTLLFPVIIVSVFCHFQAVQNSTEFQLLFVMTALTQVSENRRVFRSSQTRFSLILIKPSIAPNGSTHFWSWWKQSLLVLVIVENLLSVEISWGKIHCSAAAPSANIFRLGAWYCSHARPSWDGSNPYWLRSRVRQSLACIPLYVLRRPADRWCVWRSSDASLFTEVWSKPQV